MNSYKSIPTRSLAKIIGLFGPLLTNRSNVTETINGVLTATQAVSMGSVAMQPRAFCNAQASETNRGFVIRYMECYNK